MPRSGSHTLDEFPLPVVRIDCEPCERAGSYRLEGLIERYGGDIALPDLLMALAKCERRGDPSGRCGASLRTWGRARLQLEDAQPGGAPGVVLPFQPPRSAIST